jgi:hypothetical protein
MTARMNAARLSYVFAATERPTIVQVALSVSRSNGLPEPLLHALKLASTIALFRDSVEPAFDCAGSMALAPGKNITTTRARTTLRTASPLFDLRR